MTGLVIITAGKKEAFDDYKRTVRNGVGLADIQEFLPNDEIDTLEDIYEEDVARIWGTKVDSHWDKVQQGDIALVYRRGEIIAQARVALTTENLELAEHLWRLEEHTWDDESPWKYLVFVDSFEEIDVEIEAFNELVDYDTDFIPMGFMRVSDRRLDAVKSEYDSVETAIAELTGAGVRVHPVDDEDEGEEMTIQQLTDELVSASQAGDRDEEFEKLLAESFNRLGCTAKWIEGGGDTDVEITAPVHAVVDGKSRGGGRAVNDPKAARIAGHRETRGAQLAIVVGPRFPPAAIQDAKRNEVTVLPIDSLVQLLTWREKYRITPEVLFTVLGDAGAVQDERLDQIDEHIQDRLTAFEGILQVLEGLERGRDAAGADEIRWVLRGMTGAKEIPSTDEIEQTLHLLSHPSLRLLSRTDEGYELTTSYDNATEVLASVSTMVAEFDAAGGG